MRRGEISIVLVLVIFALSFIPTIIENQKKLNSINIDKNTSIVDANVTK